MYPHTKQNIKLKTLKNYTTILQTFREKWQQWLITHRLKFYSHGQVRNALCKSYSPYTNVEDMFQV